MKKFAYFLPALAFYALIFLVSSRNLGFSMPGQWLDKFPHAMAYAAMGFFLALGFFHVLPSPARLTVFLAFISGALLGILDEVHQKFVGGRVSDPKDAAADAVGAAVGIAAYWYWHRKRSSRPSRPSPGTL